MSYQESFLSSQSKMILNKTKPTFHPLQACHCLKFAFIKEAMGCTLEGGNFPGKVAQQGLCTLLGWVIFSIIPEEGSKDREKFILSSGDKTSGNKQN